MCEWKRFPTIIIDLDMGLARGVDFGPVAAGGVRVTICTPGLSSGAGIGESCNCPVGTGFVYYKICFKMVLVLDWRWRE